MHVVRLCRMLSWPLDQMFASCMVTLRDNACGMTCRRVLLTRCGLCCRPSKAAHYIGWPESEQRLLELVAEHRPDVLLVRNQIIIPVSVIRSLLFSAVLCTLVQTRVEAW
jgi:hypothetical protein